MEAADEGAQRCTKILFVACRTEAGASNAHSNGSPGGVLTSLAESFASTSKSPSNDVALHAPHPDLPREFARVSRISGANFDTLPAPTVEALKELMESFKPHVVYFHGGAVDGVLSPLQFADSETCSPSAIASCMKAHLPELVVFSAADSAPYAESCRMTGVPHAIFWRGSTRRHLANHFGHVLLALLQSRAAKAWDVFHLAEAATRMLAHHGVRSSDDAKPMDDASYVPPAILGSSPPMPFVMYNGEPGGKAGSRAVGTAPAEVAVICSSAKCRVAIALDTMKLEPMQAAALADALNTVLCAEARGARLVGHPVSVPPPAEAATILVSTPHAITMRCDLCTTHGARVAVVVAGTKEAFVDEQALQQSIRRSLLEGKFVSVSADRDSVGYARFLVTEAVGFGMQTVEESFLVAEWGRNVLFQLAHLPNFRTLGLLGVAEVHGHATDGFNRYDAEQLLSISSLSPSCAPSLSKYAPTDVEVQNYFRNRPPPRGAPRVAGPEAEPAPKLGLNLEEEAAEARMEVESMEVDRSGGNGGTGVLDPQDRGQDGGGEVGRREASGSALAAVPAAVVRAALRPIPMAYRRKGILRQVAAGGGGGGGADGEGGKDGFGGGGEVGGDDEDEGEVAADGAAEGSGHLGLAAGSQGQPQHGGASAVARQSAPSGSALPPIPDVPPHGCSRPSLDKCSEDEFLTDLISFLISRGHGRLIPTGGLAAFPDCNLNGIKLDLFNLYKEVVTRGGFHVGNGINWKGQIFSNMRNHTTSNKMTGVGNTLKRHYHQYLSEYERAHNDIVGEYCAVCHSADGGEWILCNGCDRWFHYACDLRINLPSYKQFACEDGPAYFCQSCAMDNRHLVASDDDEKWLHHSKDEYEDGGHIKGKGSLKRMRA